MRCFKYLLLLVCLTTPLFIVQFTDAAATMRVNEAATRVLLQDEQTNVSLAVENPTGRSFEARVTLELLDPHGRIRASAERDETISVGQTNLMIPIPLELDMESDRDELLWYRLRYRIIPAAREPVDTTEGIISLSEITPDIFELRIVVPPFARPGLRCRAQVSALHPISARPVPDVNLEGKMEFWADGAKQSLNVSGITNAEGFAMLDFDLPRNIDRDEYEIDLDVNARRGEFKQDLEREIKLDNDARILLTTDKPLYQPGQTLYLRTLVFDSAKRALADATASLTIEDPEGSAVYSASMTASRFGISSANWQIPENARLGDYEIRVAIDDDDDALASQTVKISRYDLPNFAVQVKPDHPYYLPGQQAEVTVRADYLFGQPVRRGHVRVVRETSRRWNYREQKWETKETEKFEGETNADGGFTARIDLQKEHDELAKEDYSRYRDLSYAAYFTDPTTNRTEQRRFDLRLTKDAIHIYINEAGARQAANFPLEFYISTFYADGAPAECDVTIVDNTSLERAGEQPSSLMGVKLRTIRTNRYGLARAKGLSLAGSKNQDEANLSFTAHDAKDATGRQANTFSISSSPVLRVETDKIIYRNGEDIHAQLKSSEPNMRAAVSVWQGGVVIHSEVVPLSEGHADFILPYTADLKDEVTVAAYPLSSALFSGDEWPTGRRTVLFPRDRDLKLAVQMSQPTYLPGEEAHADFSVRTSDGRAVESALGIVILDRAVEERIRTDGEFSGAYGFSNSYHYLRGDGNDLAGVSLRDLERLDLTKPLGSDLELVAEMLLNDGDSPSPRIFGSGSYETDQAQIFARIVEKQVEPLKTALAVQYERTKEYPTDEASLRRLLDEAGVSLDSVRDPWAMKYRAQFSVAREMDELTVNSAGADKRYGTSDDFVAAKLSWPYFRPFGEQINRAAATYHARTGNYIRDPETLKEELAREGVDAGALRDRWGQPYSFEFGTRGVYFNISAKSGGANGKFESREVPASDDFQIWSVDTDYFTESRTQINDVLVDFFKSTGRLPQSEAQLGELLARSGFDSKDLRDPWGNQYYAVFMSDTRFGDVYPMRSYYVYDDSTAPPTNGSKLTQIFNVINLRSLGSDGKKGTNDDFEVAGFSRTQIEQATSNRPRRLKATAQWLPGSTGAISGKIVDPNDAIVAGAHVRATRLNNSVSDAAVENPQPELSRETSTDDDGVYLLKNLPVGIYRIEISFPGFQTFVMDHVPVKSSSLTKVDGTLDVGSVAAMVTVTAEATIVNTTQSQIANSYAARQLTELPLNGSIGNLALLNPGIVAPAAQMSTPRLREYFPETLLWQPSLETDAEGQAQLKFKLADNITTWKLSVIGSTVDGEVGIAEQEIRAFQPFFVEHDPPRVLTEGDQIQLPVVLRNYLDTAQTVDVEIKPESWFALIGAAARREVVPAGDATRSLFSFRASASIKDGKQRIMAIATEGSDAIEKPVSVHPDGEEVSLTGTQLWNETATLDVNFPAETLAGSTAAELKIYPNLMAHVIEAIEGIMQRPYGCGEQTISSTYPSLLTLRAHRRNGINSPTTTKAERYLQLGYMRLLNYRVAGGGFSYWGRGDADLALTAYALRFLNDAREFTDVDEDTLQETRQWLIKAQRADGSWGSSSLSAGDATRNAMQTAYITRVLAMSVRPGSATPEEATRAASASSITRALNYLQQRADQLNEPYLIAAYALAALDAGENDRVAHGVQRLRALARDEGEMSCWSSESETPFHGWGQAGRIEMTALAVQALTRFAVIERSALANGKQRANLGSGVSGSQHATDVLADRGLLYVLSRKDRYGVWYSTQATVNVLDAIVSSMAGKDALLQTGQGETAEISVNGQRATEVSLPPANLLSVPITVDLAPYLSAGSNRVSVHRASVGSPATVQVVQTFYVPWARSPAVTRPNAIQRTLRLAVNYDKTEGETGTEVTCKVEAARTSGSGYGMLLAEIGLPPGADVDRASLEEAMKAGDWALSQYDVLPDRIVVYLWPRRGGTRFQFKFRPRFGLIAQTAPSVIYDYYNPEARTVIAPTRFTIK